MVSKYIRPKGTAFVSFILLSGFKATCEATYTRRSVVIHDCDASIDNVLTQLYEADLCRVAEVVDYLNKEWWTDWSAKRDFKRIIGKHHSWILKLQNRRTLKPISTMTYFHSISNERDLLKWVVKWVGAWNLVNPLEDFRTELSTMSSHFFVFYGYIMFCTGNISSKSKSWRTILIPCVLKYRMFIATDDLKNCAGIIESRR